MAQQTVYLFVFDSMADWEPALAVAGVNSPDHQVEPGRYRVRTVGPTRRPVRTAGGLTVLPDLALAALDPTDSAMLILPGSAAWEAGEHAEAVEAARAFLAAGVPVAAICGATFALARGGLLDDRSHTSNTRAYLAATGYRGADRYVAAPAVTDGDLITAGGAAPVDFARQVFERLALYDRPTLEAWYGLFAAAGRSPLAAGAPA